MFWTSNQKIAGSIPGTLTIFKKLSLERVSLDSTNGKIFYLETAYLINKVKIN